MTNNEFSLERFIAGETVWHTEKKCILGEVHIRCGGISGKYFVRENNLEPAYEIIYKDLSSFMNEHIMFPKKQKIYFALFKYDGISDEGKLIGTSATYLSKEELIENVEGYGLKSIKIYEEEIDV